MEVALTIAGCPLRTQLRADVEARVGSLPGVTLGRGRDGRDGRGRARGAHGPGPAQGPGGPGPVDRHPRHGPGPGRRRRARAGWASRRSRSTWPWPWPGGGSPSGSSTPTSGASPSPACSGCRASCEAARARRSSPSSSRSGRACSRCVSMGFLADEDTAIMWRGLILNRAVQQFLEDVRWGDARLPPHRHAPGHRRHPDGPGPHAAPHRGARGHHPAPGRPEGGGPRRRHGPQGPSPGGRRDREHVATSPASTAPPTPSSAAGGGAAPGRPRSASPWSARVPLHPDMAAGRRRRRRRWPSATGVLADAFDALARAVAEDVAPRRRGVGLHGPPARPGRAGAGRRTAPLAGDGPGA